jgi:hypothetical protein
MKEFYVYIHRRATTGEIFYIGKGTDGRARLEGRNRHWINIVKKHGYSVEFVQIGLQEWYAFELEIELIALYGRRDLGLGPLVNMTDGGEGICGYEHTQESREKIALTSKGRRLTNEARKKISKALADPIKKELRSKAISESKKNKPMSNKNLSALKSYWDDDVNRQKLSNKMCEWWAKRKSL